MKCVILESLKILEQQSLVPHILKIFVDFTKYSSADPVQMLPQYFIVFHYHWHPRNCEKHRYLYIIVIFVYL